MLLKQEYTIDTNMTLNEVVDKLDGNIRIFKPGFLTFITIAKLAGEKCPFYGSLDEKNFCIYPTEHPISHTVMSLEGEVIENGNGAKVNIIGRILSGTKFMNVLYPIFPLVVAAYFILKTYNDIPVNIVIPMWSLVIIGMPIVNIINARIYIRNGVGTLEKLFEK